MTRIALIFGLIAGAIMSVMMVATMPFVARNNFENGEVIGYTSMVLAFLLIYFGVRTYRDNAGGSITFGRAFLVGILIAFVASACYVATWQVMYQSSFRDFATKYSEHQLEQERARGADEATLAKRRAELEEFARRYENPIFRTAITFLEPLPVGLVLALVSAGILRRRPQDQDTMTGPRTTVTA